MTKTIKALYPGSFDPITNGHLDIARRAAAIFDHLVIGVYDRPNKNLMFTAEERLQLARRAAENLPNVEVQIYSSLTVEFARKINAHVMVRGLRIGSDFEQEFEITLMNKTIDSGLDTVCFITSIENQFLRSSTLKDVATLNGPIERFVPSCVAQALRQKFERRDKSA